MNGLNVVDLPWLLPAAPDFAAQCRSLTPGQVDAAARLRELANFRILDRDAMAFARALKKLQASGDDRPAFAPIRLGILSHANYDLMHDGLVVGAARHGVSLTVLGTEFGQIEQEAFDPGSKTNSARLDAVLLAIDHRWLGLDTRVPLEDPQSVVDEILGRIESIVKALRENGGAPTIIQTIARPPASLFGSFDRQVQGSMRAVIDRVNGGIGEIVRNGGGYVLDIDALVGEVGSGTWFDNNQWGAYKLPFYSGYGPVYADQIGRLLGAIRGKNRKVLVLDLDNTLWGGVIGDDGVGGIALGQGTARGEAFLEVQTNALALRRRGVILAVCSKNTEEIARGAFREHPEIALKETDFAVFQANWNDKVTNLKLIAQTLNVGLDSLVFFDDNPMERGHVRHALPMVAVPELPVDPTFYPWLMTAPGYFEAISFSTDDRKRTESYVANSLREQAQAVAGSIDDYLASLDMTIHFAPFDAQGRGRITQLINKTNQFNVTTRRYTELEVQRMEEGEVPLTLQVRLQDKFSDIGMIGVVICRTSEDAQDSWEFDTFLMSCRVLGRRVEECILDAVVRAARDRGVKRLRGKYVPTPKNGLVKELFPKLGFEKIEGGDAAEVYELDLETVLSDPSRPPLPFKETARV